MDFFFGNFRAQKLNTSPGPRHGFLQETVSRHEFLPEPGFFLGGMEWCKNDIAQ